MKPRGQIFVVDTRVPTPDRDAGARRMFTLLRVLRSLRFKVTFAAGDLRAPLPYKSLLEAEGVEVLTLAEADSVEDYVRRAGAGFDFVMLCRADVAAQYIEAVRAHAPRARVLFDTVDLHFLREMRRARLSGDARQLEEARARREQELSAAARVDCVLVVSPVEKSLLEREGVGTRVEVVTDAYRVRGSARPFAEREGIIYVGCYEHLPNVDAVLHYARDIYPRVRAELPGVKTFIVGYNPPEELRVLADDTLRVVGYVPDLAPHFASRRLSVAPLRFGAGIKLKIINSLSYGMPVVATTVAAEGMPLTHGLDVFIADDPAAFARGVCDLYRDAALWERLSAGGLEVVRRHYSSDALRAQMAELFDSL